MYIKYPHYVRRNFKMLAVGAACLASSFLIGLSTSGNVAPAQLIEAGGLPQTGDIDGSGYVDAADAALILEIAQGYRTATVDQLKADPNGDGQLTVDDAIRILSTISL